MFKSLMLCMSLMAISLSSLAGSTKLYKYVDKNGNVHYSDEPRKGAKQIQVEDIPTIKMKTPDYKPMVLGETEEERQIKKSLEENIYKIKLTEPTNEGVVRNNAGIVNLKATISPQLDKAHTVRFFLDGSPVSTDPKALSVTVENVTYGEHSAYMVVFDRNGSLIVQKTPVHKFSLLHVINPNKRKNRQP